MSALFVLAVPLVAQDTTRGVRIGLTYNPGTKPGVVVLRGAGVGADSIRAIVQRDLDFSDRISVIPLDSPGDAGRDAAPNWAVLNKLGAAAAVQITPTPTGLHLAVYDVVKQTTALVKDYQAPALTEARAWRAVLPFVITFLSMDVILATLACILEREPIVRAWRILPMRLIYRPMLSYCIWKAILRAFKGAWVSWGKLERTASVPVRV